MCKVGCGGEGGFEMAKMAYVIYEQSLIVVPSDIFEKTKPWQGRIISHVKIRWISSHEIVPDKHFITKNTPIMRLQDDLEMLCN